MKNAYFDEIGRWDVPIKEIEGVMNPLRDQGVRLWLVSGQQSNYITLKAGMVWCMLDDAKNQGRLEGITHLVEASSGATALSLASLARDDHFGIPNVEVLIIMNKNVPDGKRRPVTYAGAEIRYPEDGLSTIGTARKLGKQKKWLNLDQYANAINWQSYKYVLAKQVLKNLENHGVHNVNFLACPIGTGGTLIGLGEAFHEKFPAVRVIGTLAIPGQSIPGMRSVDQMTEIKLLWEEAANELVQTAEYPAYVAAYQIARETGMMVGISTGATYLAVIRKLMSVKNWTGLDSLRHDDSAINVVIVAHDGFRTYSANPTPQLDRAVEEKQWAWEIPEKSADAK